jgi:hypothetical protein
VGAAGTLLGLLGAASLHGRPVLGDVHGVLDLRSVAGSFGTMAPCDLVVVEGPAGTVRIATE